MIASPIPIFLLIDGPKTGLKLLHGQAEESLGSIVGSKISLVGAESVPSKCLVIA